MSRTTQSLDTHLKLLHKPVLRGCRQLRLERHTGPLSKDVVVVQANAVQNLMIQCAAQFDGEATICAQERDSWLRTLIVLVGTIHLETDQFAEGFVDDAGQQFPFTIAKT